LSASYHPSQRRYQEQLLQPNGNPTESSQTVRRGSDWSDEYQSNRDQYRENLASSQRLNDWRRSGTSNSNENLTNRGGDERNWRDREFPLPPQNNQNAQSFNINSSSNDPYYNDNQRGSSGGGEYPQNNQGREFQQQQNNHNNQQAHISYNENATTDQQQQQQQQHFVKDYNHQRGNGARTSRYRSDLAR